MLTPNKAEYRRLAQAVVGDQDAELTVLCQAMEGPTVVLKGAVDRVSGPDGQPPLEVAEEGAPRRPGGLGDFLSGSLAVLLAWSVMRGHDQRYACVAACGLVRRACKVAFAK
eukprot:COSAG05_NODE_7135_length_852_cov_0.849934_2_plen_111_part_01